MKQFYTTILLLAAVLLCTAGNVKAQDTEGDSELTKTLRQLSQDAVGSYVAPVISGFGSNLNSGWVTTMPEATEMGFKFELKLVAVGSFFGDDAKTFSSSGNFHLTESQANAWMNQNGIDPNSAQGQAVRNEILSQEFNVRLAGPTIVGKKDDKMSLELDGAVINGQTLGAFSDSLAIGGVLEELSILPSAAIQLGLGTVYGTDLKVRFLPSIELGEDLGKFSFWGVGFMHNPAIWMKGMELPVDLAVGFFYQNLKVGDIFESSATQFGAYAGKTFGGTFAVSPYLGLTVESSTTTVNYEYTQDTPAGPQNLDLSLDLKGDNSVGLTIGAAFKLAILNLNIDYKLASTKTASAGLSFAF